MKSWMQNTSSFHPYCLLGGRGLIVTYIFGHMLPQKCNLHFWGYLDYCNLHFWGTIQDFFHLKPQNCNLHFWGNIRNCNLHFWGVLHCVTTFLKFGTDLPTTTVWPWPCSHAKSARSTRHTWYRVGFRHLVMHQYGTNHQHTIAYPNTHISNHIKNHYTPSTNII